MTLDLLAQRGELGPGMDLDTAADLIWALSSYDLYRLLVVECGWSPADYEAHVTRQGAGARERVGYTCADIPTAVDMTRSPKKLETTGCRFGDAVFDVLVEQPLERHRTQGESTHASGIS